VSEPSYSNAIDGGQGDANDDPSNGLAVGPAVRQPVEDPPTLGRYIYRERQRTGTLQRVLTARSGISQPNISAYEQGRREPSWSVFVRLITAMGRRPVVSTEPLESATDILRQLIDIKAVVGEVLDVVADRSYRFEHNAAAHLLGLDLPVDFVHVSVVGDPDNLDELALRATGSSGRREVTTRRGGTLRPQVEFSAALAAVVLEVVETPRESVLVVVDGRHVNVAPMEDIRVQPLL
jgi:transcriptional regulator with XRE-family HTH domain